MTVQRDRINDRLTAYTLTPAEQAQAMLEYVERKTGREVTQVILMDTYWRERVQAEVVVRVAT